MNSFVGTKIYGYCDGYFGRDDYSDKVIILEDKKWIVCLYLNTDNDRVTCVNFDTEEEKTECIKSQSRKAEWR